METKALVKKAMKHGNGHDHSKHHKVTAKTILTEAFNKELDKKLKQGTTIPIQPLLWTGLGFLGVIFLLRTIGLKGLGQFVGQFAGPALVTGLYSKFAK